MISKQEYVERMERLQRKARENELDAFLVSAEESIYYLTGVSYVPLERPFFILVRPDELATLLVPALEHEHLKAAPNVGAVHRYWEYPSPPGEGVICPNRWHKWTRRATSLPASISMPATAWWN